MIVVNMHFTILEHVKDNIHEGHIFFSQNGVLSIPVMPRKGSFSPHSV